MKKYFILILLLSIGSFQISIREQNICACNSLDNQYDCENMPGCKWAEYICEPSQCSKYDENKIDCLSASQYCQWDTNLSKCLTFRGCSKIIPIDKAACANTNLQCLAYNPIAKQCESNIKISNLCSDYYYEDCQHNFGQDGLCVWDNEELTCNKIHQCSQVIEQQYCSLINKLQKQTCQWNSINNICESIIDCSQYIISDTCKYYILEPQIHLCKWEDDVCVSVQQVGLLSQSTCLINTGFTHRWLSDPNDLNNGFCSPCLFLISPSITGLLGKQCECYQMHLKKDCELQGSKCQWSYGFCYPVSCTYIENIQKCLSVNNCFWNYNINHQYKCDTIFQKYHGCEYLNYRFSGTSCSAQNLNCAGYQRRCYEASKSNKCENLTSQTDCQGSIGNNGICRWQNESCVALIECSQINDAAYCNGWKNFCLWNWEEQVCVNMECKFYKAEEDCSYIITKFYKSVHNLCEWNQQNNECQKVYNTLQLKAQNCVKNTGSFYMWSTNNIELGFCQACHIIDQIQSSQSCACSQFYDENSCLLAQYCQYTNNSCQTIPCNTITNQIICAANNNCFWNPQLGCQIFVGCQNLIANNQVECRYMSAQCKGFLDGVCQLTPHKSCQVLYYETYQKQCMGQIGTDGFCIENNHTCQGFSECYAIDRNEQICRFFSDFCDWEIFCSPKIPSCYYFKKEEDCTFYFKDFAYKIVQPCYWNQKKSQCLEVIDAGTQLTLESCQMNTNNSYRWFIKNNQCAGCQQLIVPKYQCECSQFTLYPECILAECKWEKGKCIDNYCHDLTKSACLSRKFRCYWKSQCNLFYECSSLKGETNQECYEQNVQCVGHKNGYCNQIYNNCDQNKIQEDCISKGKDGVCQWSAKQQQCQVAIQNCSDLLETECKMRSKQCYWMETCQQLTCEKQFQEFNQCTFIVNLSNEEMQPCEFKGTTCNLGYKFEIGSCFLNNNRTKRWIQNLSDNSGVCAQCLKINFPTFSRNICQCFQYQTQEDCLNAPLPCDWVYNSSDQRNSCIQLECKEIKSPSLCAQTIGCFYDFNSGCTQFRSCISSYVSSLDPFLICRSQSITCQGYSNNFCRSNPTGYCSEYSYSKDEDCRDKTGLDGLCKNWINNKCALVTQCRDLNSNECSLYPHLCFKSGYFCGNLTCESFQTKSECTYYITSFQFLNIELCIWINNKCEKLGENKQLQQNNCSVNTSFTSRWTPAKLQENLGFCAYCQTPFNTRQNQPYYGGQCACYQLVFESECQRNPNCQWSNSYIRKCFDKPCGLIFKQYQCSLNPNCAWFLSQDQCLPFSGCSSLQGITAEECANQSIYCASLSSIQLENKKFICQPTSLNSCKPNQNNINETIQECENKIVFNGICMMLPTSDPNKLQCTLVTYCSQIASKSRCLIYFHSCFWNLTESKCIPAQCGYFSQQDCSYVLSELNSPSIETIIPCQWISKYSSCESQYSSLYSFSLSEETCNINTNLISRWSPLGCISCSDYKQQIQSTCQCFQLSENECKSASPECVLDKNTKQCIEQECSAIETQLLCSKVKKCIWVINPPKKDQRMGCIEYDSNCDLVQIPNSPLSCIQSSYNCPVFNMPTDETSEAYCSQRKKCKSFSTFVDCSNYNKKLLFPKCVWEQSKCKNLSNCKQITDIAVCGLLQNTCIWNFSDYKCVQMSCSDFPTPTLCKFLFPSFSNDNRIYCEWSLTEEKCMVASQSNSVKNNNEIDPECYLATHRTHHFVNQTCIPCYHQILEYIIILLLMTL